MSTIFLSNNNVSEVLSNKRIYILGAGERAEELTENMRINGLSVIGYCVDDEYYIRTQNDIIRLSEVPYEDDVAIIYGMASVERFKHWIKECSGKPVYVWWDCLWQYNERLMSKHQADFIKAAEIYADEISRQIMKAYLLGKKMNGNENEFEYCSEGTYFNELTSGKITGGAIDCGAYTGDTIKKYINFTGNNEEKIWAFEPDPKNFRKLQESCCDMSNVIFLNYGVWDKNEVLSFSANSSGDSSISTDGDIKVNCMKIDDVVKDEKVGFIKMDVEGAERQALLGASETIRRNNPVMAISAYHLWDDLFVLPLLLDDITADGYKIYLRHHGIAAAELVIYAIPPQ